MQLMMHHQRLPQFGSDVAKKETERNKKERRRDLSNKSFPPFQCHHLTPLSISVHPDDTSADRSEMNILLWHVRQALIKEELHS